MTEAQGPPGFCRHRKHRANCHSNASRQSDVCVRNQLHFIVIESFHQTVDNVRAYHISFCSSHAIALWEAAVGVGRALMHTCTCACTHTHAERKKTFKNMVAKEDLISAAACVFISFSPSALKPHLLNTNPHTRTPSPVSRWQRTFARGDLGSKRTANALWQVHGMNMLTQRRNS